ncbi:GAF domain-containing protein [Nocardia sp. BMG111209]|uniref:GAF domain-containing protein n=1 Tax=Nocardia sp. BMG111209 TaxID=1160137 RepID=UPI00035DCBE1|nr:GAF domain-containing protein [Nocardia sp. BMG111209]
MTWYVIESLAGGSTPPTIVSVDGRRGSWIPAALLERHERIDLAGYLDVIRQDRTEIGERVFSRLGPRHLEALPILGPDGEVHGLHLWIGDPAGLPPPPDPVAGIGWNSETGRVGLSTEAWLMASEATDAYRSTLSPDECLRKIVQFDTAADLVRLTTAPRDRGAFAGTATVLHDRGSLMTWQVIARSRKAGHRTDIRGLIVDISRTEPAAAPSAHRNTFGRTGIGPPPRHCSPSRPPSPPR